MSLDVKCPKCFFSVPMLPIKSYEEVRNKTVVHYSVCQCPRTKCKYVFFVRYPAVPEPEVETFPTPYSTPEFLTDDITWTVREDIAEAYRCLHAHAFRAAIMMCRRAVQQVVTEKEAQGKTLYDKADDLAKRGLITESLRDAIKAIKYFNPYGALPESDQLQYPTPGETEDTLQVVFQLLEDLYVRSAMAQRISEKKQAVKT